MLSELQLTQNELRDALVQCQQMKVFEELIVKELRQQEEERQHLKRVAEHAVQRVHAESGRLRQDVHLAREQATISERQAEVEVRMKEEELRRAQEGSMDLQHLLLTRREYLEGLETEQRDMQTELQKVNYIE